MKLANNLTFESMLDTLETHLNCKYNSYQRHELECGFEKGIDINKYANSALSNTHMHGIRRALEYNVDISKYINPNCLPQFVEIVSDLAIFGEDIENFVSNSRLDIERMLSTYNYHLQRRSVRPLDRIIQNAIIGASLYYVRD